MLYSLTTSTVKETLNTPFAKQRNLVLPNNQKLSTWLWDSPDSLSQEQVTQYLDFCVQHYITTIYIETGKFVDLYELPPSNDKDLQTEQFAKKLHYFISEANRRGINVQALSGDVDWADSDHKYLAPLLMSLVLDYNARYPEAKLAGLQLDIEFYGQDDFFDKSEKRTQEYLELVTNLVNSPQRATLAYPFEVGFAITHWLDDEAKLKKVLWNKTARLASEHLTQILAQTPNNYLVIMAYSNNKKVPSEIEAIAENELSYAASLAVPVVIGLEVAPSPHSNITFASTDLDYFFATAQNAAENLSQYPNLHGWAIHSLPDYINFTQAP